MRYAHRAFLSVISFVAFTCALPSFAANQDVGYVPDWSYQGYNGPAYWSELNPMYAACANTRQSPISLPPTSTTTSTIPLHIHYQPGAFDEYVDNHNLYAFQDDKSNEENIAFDGKTYRLAEIHFHTPAEHQLGTQTFPLEVHFVNKDTKGHAVAIGVWIVPGAANPFIAEFLAKSTHKLFSHDLDLMTSNPTALLPDDRSFYNYQGSLTTPPCGNVTWIVMRNTITASPEQIAAFEKLLKDNARPIQKLNGRDINWVKAPTAN